MARTARRDDTTRTSPEVQRQPQPGDTITGMVARVVMDRGFCFLHADGQDYFCHFTALTNAELKDLVQGVTRVRFIASETAKGLRAEQVEVL
jgi:cold shock CspA family protein